MEVIGSQLMGGTGRWSNPVSEFGIQPVGSDEDKPPSADSESESLCKWAEGTHRGPFVERRYDADQTSPARPKPEYRACLTGAPRVGPQSAPPKRPCGTQILSCPPEARKPANARLF